MALLNTAVNLRSGQLGKQLANVDMTIDADDSSSGDMTAFMTQPWRHDH